METSSPMLCHGCQSPLAAGSPDTLCPRCLLLQAASPGEQPAEPPGILSFEARGFGDYELLEEIARGGMGVVFKARQKSLDRLVAIKLLLLGPLANEDYVKRFRFEAVAAGCLRHPHIVAIHEVGLREGQPFIAMEFVEGQNLAQVVGGRPLPVKRAAGYLKKIAEAIHAAHEAGILHRDLKPSNVMIDCLDQVRVTDFGLARRLESDSEITLSGQMLGTPNYLAPEQAVSKRGKIGRASDVFGLGAVFYHLLTGRPPQAGESVAETIQQALHVDPVKPRLLNPSVPVDAETICLKCLEKEPAKRYPTAQAVAEDLGRFLEREPILARPVSRAEHAWRWCRRHPPLAGALGALALTLVLGVAGVVWQGRKATQETARASAQREEAQRNLYAADMGLAFRALDEGNRGQTIAKLLAHRPAPGQSDLRGWEWRYLWEQCRSDEITTLGAHSNTVTVVRFFPDGGTLAAITTDGVLELWDVASRTLKRTRNSTNRLDGLSISPDGREIAVSGEYGGIELRDARTLETRSRIETGRGVDAVVHSPDGRYLAWAETGGDVALYDRAERKESMRFQTLGNSRWAWKYPLAFSPDGRYFAFGNGNHISNRGNEVTIWDCLSQREVNRLYCANGNIISVTFSPDGHQLTAGQDGERDDSGGQITVWDWRSGAEVTHVVLDPDWIGRVAYSPDGKWLATACRGQTVQILDTSDWRRVATFQGHRFEVWSVEFSPDGRLLASGSKDRTIRLWDPQLRPERQSLRDLKKMGAVSASLAQDGRRILLYGQDGTLRWMNPTTLEAGKPWTVPEFPWTTMSPSPDGSHAAFGATNGTVRLVETVNGTKLNELTGTPASVFQISFSSTGKRLIALKQNGFIDIWDLESNEILHRLKSQRRLPTAAVLSPDHGTLVIGAEQGFIEVWDLRQGIHREIQTGHTDHVPALEFSRDGRRLATTSFDGTIRLWATSDWGLEMVLSGQLTSFGQMAFSPDGRRLAAAREGGIRLWDVSQIPPLEVGTLSFRSGTGAQLAFQPDGQTLVCVDGSALHVWRAPPLQEIDALASPPP